MTQERTNVKKNANLLTNNDLNAESGFMVFKNDKDRIKYMSKAYKHVSLANAFSIFYGMEVATSLKTNRSVNTVNTISIGQVYLGTVKTFNKSMITFEIPGVKEEIVCKENFSSCIDSVNNYLLNHDNKLFFEVREKDNNQYVVSVINAYYKNWVNTITKAIQHEDGIKVHIDDLVKGGYVCHTDITPLVQLTGKPYTHSVFIPGSHIVLNIERDFEKWIGEDVIIVPQKFVEFRKNLRTGDVENSLVGSRKRVLQIQGVQNMHQMYQEWLLSKKEDANVTLSSYEGVVTGIINSNNKTGFFVELKDKYITGLTPVDVVDLVDYHPGDTVNVKIAEFEVQEGKDPFVYNKRGAIVKCNTRPVFKLA